MSTGTAIEWTDATWNPVRGCTKVSPGCKHCYAETFAERWRGVVGHPYEQGFDLRLVPEKLDEPLRWRKPRRVFVNSMSDLFQDGVPDEYLDRVFATMALAPLHTFQVLTKRPVRMRGYVGHELRAHRVRDAVLEWHDQQRSSEYRASNQLPVHPLLVADDLNDRLNAPRWPLPNVWLGVSTENQETADERISLLLQTPAAVRFVSAEPLLGPISFRWAQWDDQTPHPRRARQDLPPVSRGGREIAGSTDHLDGLRMLDWVIVGGESGPGARPCDVFWIRSIVEQCREARVACFVKQLGAKPLNWCRAILDGDYAPGDLEPDHCDLYEASESGRCPGRCVFLKDLKGADPSEWPEDLRVQEFPS